MKKRLIYLALVVLFVYFVLKNVNDGKKLLELLLTAKWEFVILALLLQAAHFLFWTLLYKRSLELYEAKWKFSEVIPLVFASLALNVFAPFAPLPGSGVFIQKARREKIPALNISASLILVILFDYLALSPLLAISLFFLFINQKIFVYEIVGGLVFIILVVSLVLILLFGVISPKILGFLFGLIETLINKMHSLIKRRNFFIKGWSSSRTLQFVELSKKLLKRGQNREALFYLAFIKQLIDVGTLFLLFLGFGTFIPVVALFTGYSLMMLFWIVTPTPQGVGFVEAITPAIFSTMGVSIETSTLAVLVFRGINLWIPVLIGFGALHSIMERKD